MEKITFSDPFYYGNVNIVTGQVLPGTSCKSGGILQLDKDSNSFTSYDFSQTVDKTGIAYIAIDEIKADTKTARILMTGNVIKEKICKADGSPLSSQDLARLQSYSANIIFY